MFNRPYVGEKSEHPSDLVILVDVKDAHCQFQVECTGCNYTVAAIIVTILDT